MPWNWPDSCITSMRSQLGSVPQRGDEPRFRSGFHISSEIRIIGTMLRRDEEHQWTATETEKTILVECEANTGHRWIREQGAIQLFPVDNEAIGVVCELCGIKVQLAETTLLTLDFCTVDGGGFRLL